MLDIKCLRPTLGRASWLIAGLLCRSFCTISNEIERVAWIYLLKARQHRHRAPLPDDQTIQRRSDFESHHMLHKPHIYEGRFQRYFRFTPVQFTNLMMRVIMTWLACPHLLPGHQPQAATSHSRVSLMGWRPPSSCKSLEFATLAFLALNALHACQNLKVWKRADFRLKARPL